MHAGSSSHHVWDDPGPNAFSVKKSVARMKGEPVVSLSLERNTRTRNASTDDQTKTSPEAEIFSGAAMNHVSFTPGLYVWPLLWIDVLLADALFFQSGIFVITNAQIISAIAHVFLVSMMSIECFQFLLTGGIRIAERRKK